MLKGLTKKRKIKTMNSKMMTNSQPLTNEPKKIKEMKTKTKQTTRTGTESEKWTAQGGISVGRGREGIGGKRYREEEA